MLNKKKVSGRRGRGNTATIVYCDEAAHVDFKKYRDSIKNDVRLEKSKLSSGRTLIEEHAEANPISIGDFTISESPRENRIMIFHISGEGGEFKKSDFGKVLKEFYRDKF